eukprot:TRINITY_DN3123_c1_g1_i3.p1 TRINITY_DN3123_c1_g1~~TRINITY_DN3123_c1_g1_i3.p1  ORF type:complete len:538 (+),score=89.80 TRINITY_DN3123_c1_g1_i3:101-1714(+)
MAEHGAGGHRMSFIGKLPAPEGAVHVMKHAAAIDEDGDPLHLKLSYAQPKWARAIRGAVHLQLKSFLKAHLAHYNWEGIKVHAKIYPGNADTSVLTSVVLVTQQQDIPRKLRSSHDETDTEEVIILGILGEAYNVNHAEHPGIAYITLLEKTGLGIDEPRGPSPAQVFVTAFVRYWEFCGYNAVHLWVDPPEPGKTSFLFRDARQNTTSTTVPSRDGLIERFYKPLLNRSDLGWQFKPYELLLPLPPRFSKDHKVTDEELQAELPNLRAAVHLRLQSFNTKLRKAGIHIVDLSPGRTLWAGPLNGSSPAKRVIVLAHIDRREVQSVVQLSGRIQSCGSLSRHDDYVGTSHSLLARVTFRRPRRLDLSSSTDSDSDSGSDSDEDDMSPKINHHHYHVDKRRPSRARIPLPPDVPLPRRSASRSPCRSRTKRRSRSGGRNGGGSASGSGEHVIAANSTRRFHGRSSSGADNNSEARVQHGSGRQATSTTATPNATPHTTPRSTPPTTPRITIASLEDDYTGASEELIQPMTTHFVAAKP